MLIKREREREREHIFCLHKGAFLDCTLRSYKWNFPPCFFIQTSLPPCISHWFAIIIDQMKLARQSIKSGYMNENSWFPISHFLCEKLIANSRSNVDQLVEWQGTLSETGERSRKIEIVTIQNSSVGIAMTAQNFCNAGIVSNCSTASIQTFQFFKFVLKLVEIFNVRTIHNVELGGYVFPIQKLVLKIGEDVGENVIQRSNSFVESLCCGGRIQMQIEQTNGRNRSDRFQTNQSKFEIQKTPSKFSEILKKMQVLELLG